MPTLHFKSKTDFDAEMLRLAQAGWRIYISYQAADGSWVAVVFEGRR